MRPLSRPTAGLGYLHRNYAQALGEFGEPKHLAGAQGWLLVRSIPDTDRRDAIGCYPLLCCENWTALAGDLNSCSGEELITLTAVIDPLASVPPGLLKEAFPDLVEPYKEHFVVECGAFAQAVDKQHVRKARRALRSVSVELVEDPVSALDEWVGLYANLARKHGIVGLTAFSRASFARQLQVPGIALFRASENGKAVAAAMWYVNGAQAYYHLGASSERGYEIGASFALFWVALNHFAEQDVQIALLGAGAGAHNDGSDGLSRFKAGWATGTRRSYLCGRIFNPDVYEALAARTQGVGRDYFPKYRSLQPGI